MMKLVRNSIEDFPTYKLNGFKANSYNTWPQNRHKFSQHAVSGKPVTAE